MVAGANEGRSAWPTAAAVDKAVSQGKTWKSSAATSRRIVEERGWHGWTGEDSAAAAPGGRASSIAPTWPPLCAGRWAQLREAGYPFIIYHHGNSPGAARPATWPGMAWCSRPIMPFWATHAPPNGWGCSCYVSGARTMDAARRQGGKPGKELPDGWQTRDPRTARLPGSTRAGPMPRGRAWPTWFRRWPKRCRSFRPTLGRIFGAIAPEVALAARPGNSRTLSIRR